MKLILDLKPALSKEQLDARILREFDANANKQFRKCAAILPAVQAGGSYVWVVWYRTGETNPRYYQRRAGEILSCMKELELTVTGLRGYNEAIITKGGVSVKEIDPGTMECKNIPGLYFIGEVLDLDAVTGGFNLQIAWSTAVAAANAL